jgi:hypothetical protein
MLAHQGHANSFLFCFVSCCSYQITSLSNKTHLKQMVAHIWSKWWLRICFIREWSNLVRTHSKQMVACNVNSELSICTILCSSSSWELKYIWQFNSVNIGTGYEVKDRCQIPKGEDIFLSVALFKTGFGAHSASHPIRKGVTSPRVEQPGSEADHSFI